MPAVNPVAWAMFSAVDVDRSGNINERELQTALSHGGWLPFSIKTTRMLIKMFDVDRSGKLTHVQLAQPTIDTWPSF